jgi:hypothetical protein
LNADNNKAMSNKNAPEPKDTAPFLIFLENSVSNWIDKNVKNEIKFTTISAITIITSIIATNLLTLTIIPNYLYFIAATPAAIAATILTFYYTETVNKKITEYKEKYLPKQRIRNAIIAATAVAGTLVFLNITTPPWLTMGIGGVVLITSAFLLSISSGKNEQEHRYYKMGIVDPREEV